MEDLLGCLFQPGDPGPIGRRFQSIRLERLNQDLAAIQRQFEWHSFQKLAREEQCRVVQDLLRTRLIECLKEAADQLRQFLWCYIDSRVAVHDKEVDYALQSQQLEQVTGLLRLLYQHTPTSSAGLPFMEQATETVERHLDDEVRPTGTIGETA